jgi:hypothetical protein
MSATPYEDSVAHLRDELARVDLLLRLHLERWWAEGGGGEFTGLYISDEEVDRLLRDPDAIAGDGGRASAASEDRAGTLRDRLDALSGEIQARQQATAAAGTELRLPVVARRFDLGQIHRDALLLALAPELERKYEKVYAYLQDDVTRTRPTVELLLAVLCGTATDRLAVRDAFSRHSPLVRGDLVHLIGEPNTPLPSCDVAVADRVVEYLLGGDALPPDVDATVRAPEQAVGDLSVDEQMRRRLRRLTSPPGRETSRGEGTGRRLVYVHGPYGSAKDDAVAAVCAARDVPVVWADAGEMGLDDPESLVLDALVLEARLRDAALYLRDLAPDPAAESERSRSPADAVVAVADRLDGFDGPVFVSGERPVSPRLGARLEGWSVSTLGFEAPAYDRRRELWESVALPAGVDPADLASKFRLTAGQVEDAVATARTIADGGELTASAVYAACRSQSRERLGSLAEPVETGYTWSDIVLPPDTMAHLREVAAHVEHRGQVYTEWGFEERYSHGTGLNVLFTGPPGTGKTMAAEIVAGEAGLDLYRIDLASVVSKYIGETEQNLKAVFDEAEGSDAVLFFDEADALFGERSEVSDSKDRYANVEVSYLLQRMEDHDGTVVLASNLEENIDDAFRRRINLSVEFPMPDREARAAIWDGAFPEATPTADLDVEFLAGFELAGGNITNAALTAAFLAAEEDAPVGMDHVVRALRRELEKTGRLVNPEQFGDYSESARR